MSNAKEILKSVLIENNTYTDIKPVREALGTAYLAVLEAIDEALIRKGLSEKELPQSVDAYRKDLQKYLAVHDGRLLREFESLYRVIHIAGYYRRLLDRVDIVRDAMKAAKAFIEKIKNLLTNTSRFSLLIYDGLVKSRLTGPAAGTGVQCFYKCMRLLDSGFRRNDDH